MTKLRAPCTIEDATNRVIGLIGMDAAVEATGRSADYLRSLTDPDKRYRLTIEDALKLDLAHEGGGHVGTPIFATYGLLLDQAHASRFADRHQLVTLAAKLVKEAGEAGYYAVKAGLPGATAEDELTAEREIQEAVEAAQVVLAYFARQRAPAREPPP